MPTRLEYTLWIWNDNSSKKEVVSFYQRQLTVNYQLRRAYDVICLLSLVQECFTSTLQLFTTRQIVGLVQSQNILDLPNFSTS